MQELDDDLIETWIILDELGFTLGGAEARKLIHNGAVIINGEIAGSIIKKPQPGDILKCGKHKVHIFE